MSQAVLDEKVRMEREVQSKERRDKQISGAISGGIVVILLFLSMFWPGWGLPPKIEQTEWETIGRVDFGTDALGRLAVNNFQQPSPTPADRPKTQPTKQQPVENPAPQEASTPPPEQPKSTTESDNKVQENTNPAPNQQETVADPTPKTETPTNNTPSPPNRDDNNSNETATNETGGSNQGDTNQDGNRGNPNANVLDDNGMFEFGDGVGGPGGRRPLDIPLPKYNIQKEGRVTYSFYILPSGETANIRAMSTPHMDLAEIGKQAIKNWRFSETDPGAGNLKTTVTITFRLK